MRKLIDKEVNELHEEIRKAFVERSESMNNKLEVDSRKPVPSEQWTMLVTQALVNRNLDTLDDIFNCASDWNRLSKLAVLDVIKLSGFDVDMKTTGKNMMKVICEQIDIDVGLFNSIKKQTNVMHALSIEKENISHMILDEGLTGDVPEFIDKLIYEKGYTEIIKVGRKSYLGSTIQNYGYPLHSDLNKFVSLSVDMYNINQDVEKFSVPGEKLVWGENKIEQPDELMSMGPY